MRWGVSAVCPSVGVPSFWLFCFFACHVRQTSVGSWGVKEAPCIGHGLGAPRRHEAERWKREPGPQAVANEKAAYDASQRARGHARDHGVQGTTKDCHGRRALAGGKNQQGGIRGGAGSREAGTRGPRRRAPPGTEATWLPARPRRRRPWGSTGNGNTGGGRQTRAERPIRLFKGRHTGWKGGRGARRGPLHGTQRACAPEGPPQNSGRCRLAKQQTLGGNAVWGWAGRARSAAGSQGLHPQRPRGKGGCTRRPPRPQAAPSGGAVLERSRTDAGLGGHRGCALRAHSNTPARGAQIKGGSRDGGVGEGASWVRNFTRHAAAGTGTDRAHGRSAPDRWVKTRGGGTGRQAPQRGGSEQQVGVGVTWGERVRRFRFRRGQAARRGVWDAVRRWISDSASCVQVQQPHSPRPCHGGGVAGVPRAAQNGLPQNAHGAKACAAC